MMMQRIESECGALVLPAWIWNEGRFAGSKLG